MGGLFDPTRGFWRVLGKLADLLMLSVVWAACSVPVITMGASTCALYDSCIHCVRGDDPNTLQRFWSTFKRELKTSIKASCTFGLFTALLIALVFFIRSKIVFEGAAAAILTAFYFVVLIIPVGACCWMFPMLSRFSFDAKSLIVTGIKIAVSQLPRTIVIVLAALAEVSLIIWLILPAVLLPALVTLLWTLLMEPVFKKYM